MKKAYLVTEGINTLLIFKAIIFLLLVGHVNSYVYSGNTISPGTKVKIAQGTTTVSNSNFVIKTGGSLDNQGNLILKKNFLNECTDPTPIGQGSIIFEGDAQQLLSGKNVIQNLVIDNLMGLKLAGFTQVLGSLTLENGILSLDEFHLELGTYATITGNPSQQKMINATGNGQLRKKFPLDFTGSFTYPVGDIFETPDYTPVTIQYAEGTYTQANFVGISLRNDKFPDTTITDNYINRYWYVTDCGNPSLKYNMVFHYAPGDVVGDESQIMCYKIANGQTLIYQEADTENHTLSADSVSTAGSFTGGGGGSLPPPALSGPVNTCLHIPGNLYTTDPGKSNYNWNVSAGGEITSGGTPNDHFAVITWHSEIPQSVTVSYFGSSGSTTLEVGVFPVPLPTIDGPSDVCENSTGLVYSTEPGMVNYQWVVSQGGIITAGAGTNQITVAWNSTGSHTVSVNYSNCFGCSAPSSTVYPVLVNPLLPVSVSIIESVNNICAGTEVVYTANPVNEGTNPVYQWFRNFIPVGTNSPFYACVPQDGDVISVRLISSEPCQTGPANSSPITMIVHPVPVPTITGLTDVCEGIKDVIYKTETDMNGYVWTISSGGIITAGEGTSTIQVTWNTPGNHLITVNYSNSFNCTSAIPAVHAVQVHALPVPSLAGEIHVCAGVAGEVYTTEPGMSNYSWIISPGGTITSGSDSHEILVTWNTPGTNFVKVNYTNQAGCVAQDPTTKTVFVHVLASPTISGPVTSCLNTVSTYSTEAGMSDYNWNVSQGGIILSGSAGNSSINVLWTQPGARFVTVNYANGYGCSALAPTVKDIFVTGPIITGPEEVCKLSVVTYLTQAEMGDSYIWSYNGGIKIGGGGSSDNYITIKWIASGNRYVSVTFTNNSCTATNKLPVVVHNSATTIVGPSSSCTYGYATYESDPGMRNYIWTVSQGGEIVGPGDSSKVVILWNTPGDHTVAVDYDSPFGCDITPTMIHVMVYSNPVPTLTGPAGPFCLHNDIVTYITEPDQLSYQWEISSGCEVISGGGNHDNMINLKWIESGEHWIKVNYITKNHCTATEPEVLPVSIYALPVPSIDGPDNVVINSVTTYYTETNMTGFEWVVSEGGTIVDGGDSLDSFVSIQWTEEGPKTITLTYVDPNGCSPSEPAVFHLMVNPTIKSAEFDPQSITENNRQVSGNMPLFNVYPNPSNGRFTISIENQATESCNIQIYNGLGAVIYQLKNIRPEGVYKQLIDLGSAAEGVYTVIVNNSENSASKRIHIRK